MVDPYDATALFYAVRNRLVNISEMHISDAQMTTICAEGKRRLDDDKPNEVTRRLAANAQGWHNLTLIDGWVPGFSLIRAFYNPANNPAVGGTNPINVVDPLAYEIQIVSDETDPLNPLTLEYLQTTHIVQTGTVGQIRFTTPWKIDGLDGATKTTITNNVKNALELICAVKVMESLAAEAAGHISANIPVDLINWSDKHRQYISVANEMEKSYMREVHLKEGMNKPVIVRGNYSRQLQSGFPYMTHRRSWIS